MCCESLAGVYSKHNARECLQIIMASVFSHITKTHIKPYARAKPLGHIPVPGITFKSIVFYLAAEVIVLLLENHNKGMVSQTDRQAMEKESFISVLESPSLLGWRAKKGNGKGKGKWKEVAGEFWLINTHKSALKLSL